MIYINLSELRQLLKTNDNLTPSQKSIVDNIIHSAMKKGSRVHINTDTAKVTLLNGTTDMAGEWQGILKAQGKGSREKNRAKIIARAETDKRHQQPTMTSAPLDKALSSIMNYKKLD